MTTKTKSNVKKTHLLALRTGIISALTLMFYFVPVLISVPTPASATSHNVVTVVVPGR